MPYDHTPETLTQNFFQRAKPAPFAQSHSTPFVGRERELADIRQRLSDPTCRLLTLVGPGGMGKTRLAQEALLCFDDGYPDGVYFVALQPLTSPDLITSALAETLHLQFDGSDNPKNQLLHFLRDTTMLLVLDNFEHLLEGIGLIHEILAHAPAIKILVTSRERLNLRDEWIFEVRGLSFPAAEISEPTEEYSAVQLFTQNARRVKSDFSLANESQTVTRICGLLEGMPLAIELASSWVRALSCADILAQIERGLDILETPARDVPKRHQSMRTVLNTSWNYLSETGQAVFMKASLFHDGFSLNAIQVIAGATPLILSVLIDQSWLRLNSEDGRYEVHELLRQYGEEKLGQSGKANEVHEAHCHYYAEFVHELEIQMKGHGQIGALKEMEADFENIRAGWNWGIHHGKETEIGAMVYGLWFFLDTFSRYREGEQLFGEAAAILQAGRRGSSDSLLLGKALAAYGAFHHALEHFAEAIACLEQALTIFQSLDAPSDMAFCLLRMGDTWVSRGQLLKAQPCFQRSLDLYRELGDESGIMGAFYGLALTHQERDLLKAGQLILESRTLAERIGNLWGTANATTLQGEIMRRLGDYQESWNLIRASNALYQELGVRWGIAMTFSRLGYLAILMGNYPESRRCLLNALTIAEGSRLTRYILYCLDHYSDLLEAQGAAERAVEIFALIERQSANAQRDHARLSDKHNTLQSKLTPPQFAAAVERGQSLDLDAAVKMVMAELSQPFEAIQAPHDSLTTREVEVLRLVADGLSNQEIAEKLVLTRGTVKWYMNDIFSKLGVSNRTQAVARARELNLLS